MNLRSVFGAPSLAVFLLIVVFDPLRCCVPSTDSVAAQFPPAIIITEGKTPQGFPFFSGGVSTDERDRMEEIGKSYNVKLTFAEKKGAFVAGVRLVIQGEKGAEIVNMLTDGPWFYIQLPAGVYKLQAIFEGEKKEVQRLTVSKDTRIQQGLVWDLGEKGAKTSRTGHWRGSKARLEQFLISGRRTGSCRNHKQARMECPEKSA